jgi:hypothetical protein
VRSTNARAEGTWKASLGAAGKYRIRARIPASNATTRSASYRIRTPDGWVVVTRDQSRHAGTWMSLGVHRLGLRPVVRLSDLTGEATTTSRRIVFDAIKFVPVVTGARVTASSGEPGQSPPGASRGSDAAAPPTATPRPEPAPSPAETPEPSLEEG